MKFILKYFRAFGNNLSIYTEFLKTYPKRLFWAFLGKTYVKNDWIGRKLGSGRDSG